MKSVATSTIIVLLLCIVQPTIAGPDTVTIIASRGAGAYLPENTLAAYVLAAALHSDYVSMEVVMSRDNQLVVYRDIDLSTGTNVAALFPQRARQDGRYYPIDFTLAELQQLQITPDREAFPTGMRIPALAETLSLLQQLEEVLGRTIGIAIEIKKPWFHLSEGRDISSATLDQLQASGVTGADRPVLLQCHDPEELQSIKKNLLDSRSIAVKLVQLLDTGNESETQRLERDRWLPYNSEWLYTRFGTRLLALYADAVEIDQSMILTEQTSPLFSDFLTGLHLEKIKIHLRLDGNPTAAGLSSETAPDLFSTMSNFKNIEAVATSSPDIFHALRKKYLESVPDSESMHNQPLNIPTPEKDQNEHLY